MNDENETVSNDEPVSTKDELSVLKERADKMGLSYHPSIGVDKLRAKVNDALTPSEGASLDGGEKTTTTTTKTVVDKAEVSAKRGENESEGAYKKRKRKEASELVRIRLTCMNPNKRELEGEIFAAGNAVVGTYKKFVPYNAEEGYHVPRIIYNQLVQRKCQVFQTVRDKKGNASKKGKLIKEFNIEVLPPLTKDELKELAQRQAMSNSIDQ